MKKIMMVGSALMLLSTSAFATKARLQALGEDKDGSYFVSDYRNIYINPAELNSLENMAVLEWGKAGSAFGNASLDTDNATKAQGGMFYTLSNGLKLGAIMGDETDVAALTRMLASNGGSSSSGFMQTADNVLDVFVAGKGSINWGANLLYTSTKNEETGSSYKQNAYAMRLGVSQESWNAHTLIALGAKADMPDNANAPSYKGKIGFRVGGGYNVNAENKAFGMYEMYGWKQDNATTSEREGSFKKALLGFGHEKKIATGSTLFAKLQGELTNIKLDTSTGNTAAAKIDRLAFPLTIGFEHNATEWLVVRGSVSQNLYGTVKDEGLTTNFGSLAGAPSTAGEYIRYLANARYGSSTSGNGGKKTLANSTAVTAGATLVFGKVNIDGLVGTTSSTGTSDSKKGVLALGNLETRVGMTYNF